jgi:hypothetical protein
METVIYKGGQGMGVILAQDEKLTDSLVIDKSNVELGDTVLVYEQETTLCGWFDSPVLYHGKDEDNQLYFRLGVGGGDLFEPPKAYYETMLYVTPTRFYRNYSWKGGRDFNFLLKKWK